MNNSSRFSKTSSMSDPPERSGGPVRNQSGQRLRRFVFTLNNYTPQEYIWLTKTFVQAYNPSWLIVGKEVGENGTRHLQGACILGGQRTFSTVKMWPGFRRAHLETMRGQPLDSKTYCSKEDSQPFEFGTLPTPGKRTDLLVAVEAINEGESLRDMAMGEHGVAVVKFFKGLTVLRSLRSPPRDPSVPPRIYWIHGPTGSGKTRRCFELGSAYAGPSDVWISNGSLQWFDGYDGQRVVIIDDFRAKGTKFEFILRLLDRYPFSVPFKGGFVNWAPEIIFVTTPHDVRTTFEARFKYRPEDIGQLERRILQTFELPGDLAELGKLFTPAVAPRPVVDVEVIGSSSSSSSSSAEEETQVNSYASEDERLRRFMEDDDDLSFDN